MNRIPEGCVLLAHHTGEGWSLEVWKNGEIVAMLKWPDSWPDSMTADDLRSAGFRIA